MLKNLAIIFIVSSLILISSPLLSNSDDHIRYYFGGLVGLATILGEDSSLSERIRHSDQMAQTLEIGLELSRYKTARNPYSLILIPISGVVYILTKLTGISELVLVLAVHTGLWYAFWLLGYLFLHRFHKELNLKTLFLVLLLSMVLIRTITTPFDPLPRTLCLIFTLYSLYQLRDKGNIYFSIVTISLASLFHPYNQLLNFASGFTLLLISQLLGKALVNWRRLLVWSLVQSGALVVAVLIVLWAQGKWDANPLELIESSGGICVGFKPFLENIHHIFCLKSFIFLMFWLWISGNWQGAKYALLTMTVFGGLLGASLSISSDFYPCQWAERMLATFSFWLAWPLFEICTRSSQNNPDSLYNRLSQQLQRLSRITKAGLLLIFLFFYLHWFVRPFGSTLLHHHHFKVDNFSPIERIILESKFLALSPLDKIVPE